jgi:hypothetical protein
MDGMGSFEMGVTFNLMLGPEMMHDNSFIKHMCNFCSGIFFRIESNNNVAAA